MLKTTTVKLERALSKAQIDRVWNHEQKLVNLPSLLFEVKGREVTIAVDPRHGGRVAIEEIKRPFQTAVHRKFGPDFTLEWLDGPLPPPRFSTRSMFATQEKTEGRK